MFSFCPVLALSTMIHRVYQITSCDCFTCDKSPKVFVSPGGSGSRITDAEFRSPDPVAVPAPVPAPGADPALVPMAVAVP